MTSSRFVREHLKAAMAAPVDIDLVEAFWRIGWIDPEELEHIATSLLAEGRDSPALVALAGHLIDRNEVGRVFDQALCQIGHETASSSLAGARASRYVAAKIVSGELSPEDGVSVMSMLCLTLAIPRQDDPAYSDYPDFLMRFYLMEDDISDRGVCTEECRRKIIEEAQSLVDRELITED